MHVYVSGPYTKGNPETNTERAIDVAEDLIEEGHVPFVPHLSHYWHEYSEHSYEYWMKLDLDWLPRCDALVRIPGPSDGADREVALAMELGIPVYEGIDNFLMNNEPPRPSVDSVPPPVRQALDRIEATFAKKNKDYADDRQAWSSNFDDTSRQMGWASPQEAAEALIAVKQSRLRSMRANGRPPANEAVDDTILDRAVYSVISLALLMEEAAPNPQDAYVAECGPEILGYIGGVEVTRSNAGDYVKPPDGGVIHLRNRVCDDCGCIPAFPEA